MIGSSVIFGGFPSRFLKCCSHSFTLSCWLAAFNFALAVLFLLLTLFIVCQANLDCLSSTDSLILSIWFCMYSACSFRYTPVNWYCAFYEDLSSLVRSILKHNLLVIGRDMNAQMGKNRNNKYSPRNASNRNGQHLIDFMIENRLTCLNTNFQKREWKLWTYTYANKSKAQIDYVFINRKWKNSAMNCEAYSSFEGASSDHRIVTAKVRLSLRKNATRKATTKHYDWALLNNRDIRDKYALELWNRFEALQEKAEKGTPNDEYENFVEAHLEAAAKCIPTKPRTKYRVPWETLAVREKRALVKTASKSYRKNPTNTNARKLEKNIKIE